MTATETLRIYVASLSDYNAGILHGVHIDLDETTDVDEVWEKINAMLAASPATKKYGDIAEEHAIHDTEGFGNYSVSEYESIETVVKVAALISEHGEAFAAFLDNGNDASDDDIEERFTESYCGTFDSEKAYVEDLVDDTGFRSLTSEQLDELSGYLDWDAITNDLMQDYWSAQNSDHDTMIFRSY